MTNWNRRRIAKFFTRLCGKSQQNQLVIVVVSTGMENVNKSEMAHGFYNYNATPGYAMREYSLYSAILGLSSEWRILNVTVDEQTGITELHIRSQKTGAWRCPTCGAGAVSAGAKRARWLHQNHLNIRFFISALIPVMNCERCGKIKVAIPWERSSMHLKELEGAQP